MVHARRVRVVGCPRDPAEECLLAPAAACPQGLVVACPQDPAEECLLAPAAACPLAQGVECPQDRAVECLLVPEAAFQLGRVVGVQLVPAVAPTDGIAPIRVADLQYIS